MLVKMTKYLNLLFFLLISNFLLAQNPTSFCGTDPIKSKWLDDYQKNPEAYPSPENGMLYIPLTVHIVGKNDGTGYYPPNRVLDALCTLNEDFAESEIRFFLKGELRYIANSNYYTHNSQAGAQMMNIHNVAATVNCYIVEDPAGNCGYFSWWGDAIALKKSCIGPSDHTWAHEIGHYLSLPHTFYGWEGIDHDYSKNAPAMVDGEFVERANGSNCNFAADGFCDTPADYLNYRWACDGNSMSTLEQKDPTGATFKSDGSFFMSYALDNCSNKFSGEQIGAMRANIQFQRPYLLNDQSAPVAITSSVEGIYPIDGQEVSPSSVFFEWEPIGNATHYILDVSRLANFPFVTHRILVSGNSVILNGFENFKDYYWRIRPFGKYDFSCNGYDPQVFSFSTNDAVSSTGQAGQNNWTLSIAPNPTTKSQSAQLMLQSPQAGEVFLSIIDLNGKVVRRMRKWLDKGEQSWSLSTEGLQAGFYQIGIESEYGRQYIKWILH
jgi:hypothetical protein